jgi:hypothetical protein
MSEKSLGCHVATAHQRASERPPRQCEKIFRPNCNITAAGIPARVVGRSTVAEPALEMDATFPFPIDGGAGI